MECSICHSEINDKFSQRLDLLLLIQVGVVNYVTVHLLFHIE